MNFFEYDSKTWIFFFEYDSKNWTFCSNTTQRIEPFPDTTQRIEPFLVQLKELNLFFYMTQRIELFPVWLTELNFFFKKKKRFTEIEPFLCIRLREMDLFLGHDAKSWTPYFLHMTQRIEPIIFLNMTHRIEPSFIVTQRIELFFSIWFKELNSFLHMTQRIELHFLTQRIEFLFNKRTITQRIEPFFFFSVLLTELNPLKKQISDSKYWFFF